MPRYIIVLDRYDDDDYGPASKLGYGHDGTEQGAIEQVALELQESMNVSGVPAGFFNVVARLDDTRPNVSQRQRQEVLAEVLDQLEAKQ